MIKLIGGVELPLPEPFYIFKNPEGLGRFAMRSRKRGLWEQAYNQCLIDMHSLFHEPFHIMVSLIGRGMPILNDNEIVALRFLGEMELAGYIKIKTGRKGTSKEQERQVTPTRKLLKLKVAEITDGRYIVMPKIVGKDEMPTDFTVRKGFDSRKNKETVQVTHDIANQSFRINTYMLDILTKFPPTSENLSKSMALTRTMASAKVLKGKVFKFPYFLDSRGRGYDATTCGVSPQGADHEKALLAPAQKKKLTKEGYDALIETCWGYSEIEWTPEEMASHADQPALFVDEWMKADKPYSYLAHAEYVRRYLENPSALLPAFIPLDGRCSGLQHWSALVRSESIMKHIGMDEEEAELDIYEMVAEAFKAVLPDAYKHLATRKSAKKTTMTWGYNATMMTSIADMRDMYGPGTTEDMTYEETGQLGKAIYNSLGDTLQDLGAGVEWVTESAGIIATAGNTVITWVTPDGFTCMQTKNKGEPYQLDVVLSDGSRLKVNLVNFKTDIPNIAKHKSAIAPNIIHSLDATHLRMVARELAKKRYPMIFIHDSFSTHVNMREYLYKAIITTFSDLYSGYYLTTLKEYWEEKYDVELSPVPPVGRWDPQNILPLKRFFI